MGTSVMWYKIQPLDVAYKTTRIYNSDVLKSIVQLINRSTPKILGQIGSATKFNSDISLNLLKVSHVLNEARILDGWLEVHIVILDTMYRQQLINAKNLDFYMVGTGTCENNIVQNYNFFRIDVNSDGKCRTCKK